MLLLKIEDIFKTGILQLRIYSIIEGVWIAK